MQRERGDRSFDDRIVNLACYDPVVAMYILVLIFKLVWLIVGSVWLANAGDECPSEVKDMVTAAIIIGFVVLAGGGCSFFCCALECKFDHIASIDS